VDIDAVNELLDLEHAFTAIEIKLNAYTNVKSMKHAIQNVVGPKYKIMDKYEQDEAFLRIMNIEKWISYLIASLSLLIIAFNMVGSLWMLVLEKSKDIAILKSMGFSDQKIKWIYLTLGWMISIIGLVAGMVLATIAYYGQKEYGWVSIPEGFLIDAYPVKWVWRDMLIVILTVLAIGYIASIIPSRRAAKISKLISTINR
jgi:lipoprotein-releasing system permease protein